MALWLDHKIFGNGFGLGSPFFDQRYYWLVDTSNGRQKGRGTLYTFMGGFGAQLHSRQWRHPKPGERRRLAGREFVAFRSSRRWLRVEVAWSMADAPSTSNIDDLNAAIRSLKKDLDSGVTRP